MAQTLGLIDVIWKGQKIDVEKGGKFKLGGLLQKGTVVGQQVDHFNEFEKSEVTATTRLRRGDKLMALFAPGAGELQIQCDTGQTYSWDDAFIVNLAEVTAGDGGKIQIKWEGGVPSELVAG